MEQEKSQLNIYEYSDYREFLKAYYNFMKMEKACFSYRYFSKIAGFSSPNFLKLVMDGKRNLSSDGIEKFTKAIKLNPQEARYFRLMVLRDQADTPEEKDFFVRQILKTKTIKKLKPLSQAKYDYYSQWYHIPLRELVERSDFKDDPSWIANQFTPPLTEKQAKDGLKLLEELNFIKRDENGRLRQVEKVLSTGDEVTGQGIANFHRIMMEKAAKSIEIFQPNEREISSLTLGVSHKNYKKIKSLVQSFRKEILGLVDEDESLEKVVQLNFQLFPLTKDIETAGE